MKVGSVLAKQSAVPVASPRFPSLDGLRALSITLVCVAHFAYTPGFPIHHNLLLDVYAHIGVRIFFVISGYLITTLLIREQKETGTINIKQFIIRRAYRILPVAYVYLIVVTIIFHKSLTTSELAIAYTYLSSYARHLPWVLSHLWSLSVEEQFYLIWPVAMAFSFTLARRFAFAAIVFAPLIRFALSKLGVSMGAVYFFPSVTDSLASGCLLAMFHLNWKGIAPSLPGDGFL